VTVHFRSKHKWSSLEFQAIQQTAERLCAALERAVRDIGIRHAHEDLDERIAKGTTEVEVLVKQLFQLQEQERRRIARDLHDHLGQQITALRLAIASLKTLAWALPDMAEHAARAERIAMDIDDSIDALTWDLRPDSLDDLGAPAAIEQLVARWSARAGIPAGYDASRIWGLRVYAAAGLNLYRIVEEALHNIEKHAQATRVNVVLERRDERLQLVIEDDGRGFNPAAVQRNVTGGSLGLVNIRERAALFGGSLEIDSTPASGTTLYVRLPLSRILEPWPAPSA
jgi:signal transduction histidine kinase